MFEDCLYLKENTDLLKSSVAILCLTIAFNVHLFIESYCGHVCLKVAITFHLLLEAYSGHVCHKTVFAFHLSFESTEDICMSKGCL